MVTGMPSQIAVKSEEGQPPTLVLRGDVTIFEADRMHEAATALLEHEADVVVSCREMVRLDTAILQILLVLQRELQSRGRSIRLEGVSDGLRELLELAGVSEAFAGPAAAIHIARA